MTTCLGKSRPFGLLCVSIVKVYESLSICMCASFSFGFDGGMWDLIVLVPDHCLSFTLPQSHKVNEPLQI